MGQVDIHIDKLHAPTHSLTPRKQDPLDDFLDTKTAQTARAVKTFHGSYLPRLGSQPSTGSHVVNKRYADRKSGSPHSHAGTTAAPGGGTSFMLGGSVTSPLVDYLSGLGAGSLYRLPNIPATLPNALQVVPVGGKFLLLPISNASNTVNALNLFSFAYITMPTTPGLSTGGAPAGPHSRRYIYMHQGLSAAAQAGSAFWRFDLWRQTWAAQSRITVLNASYSFGSFTPLVYDTSRYFYTKAIRGLGGASILVRYDTQNGSWARIGSMPISATGADWINGSIFWAAGSRMWEYRTGAGTWVKKAYMGTVPGVSPGLIKDPKYTGTCWLLGGEVVLRYSIPGDAWTNVSPAAGTLSFLMQGRGVYFAKPYPHILGFQYAGAAGFYLYKV